MSSSSIITLPIATVQHDFPDILADAVAARPPPHAFWLSCYKAQEPSVHAMIDVDVDPDSTSLLLAARDGDVDITAAATPPRYTVACKALGIPPTDLLLPVQDYRASENIRPQQRITAFDVAPDASRFATGHLDGSVYLYPSTALPRPDDPSPTTHISSAKLKITSKPHLSNVTALQFFPSSRVLLTCGGDFALSILSAELPPENTTSGTRIHPVRVLRAHTRSVTSASIIALGRNILSSSLDSSLRLWDVPSGSVIRSLHASAPVLCTTIGARIPTPPDGEDVPIPGCEPTPQDERETPEVATTVTYAGLQNGSFEVFDLGTKSSIYKSPRASSAPINTVSYLSSQYLLATGAADGVVTLYDVRSLASPLTFFRRNEAGISGLDFAPNQSSDFEDNNNYQVGLAVATTDGLPYVASVIPEGPGVYAELAGVDCDPVMDIRVRNSEGGQQGRMEVWYGCDDGIVRRYLL